jgi:hypothetical protein
MVTILLSKPYHIKEIRIQTLQFYGGNSTIRLVGTCEDGFILYIHINYLIFYKFKKYITSRVLYKLFDHKTSEELTEKNRVVYICKNFDLLTGYKIIKEQSIQL